MFRYIALVWDGSKQAASVRAQRLGEAWSHRDDWTTALQRPGLHVYTSGEVPGVNQAHALQGGQGVVLGKVFRREDLVSTSASNPAISCKAAWRIVASGGQDLVDSCWGRYVAILQTAEGDIHVLRDPSGTLPCYLIRQSGIAIVFSWLEDALELLDTPAPDQATRRVNWSVLGQWLSRGATTGHETSLEGISQVLPGERVDLQSGARILLWNGADFARAPLHYEVGQAAALLRQRVQACTAAWAGCYDALMLRLSGGIDSSILLSCLAPDKTKADVIGLNYYSEGSDSDERHYARLAARRAGRDLLERQRDPGFRIDSVLQMARMPDPVPYVGAMNASTDARLTAAHGATALFTGAGGDSLFYEFPRWWPAADYLHTKGLDIGFLAAAMDAARLGRLSVWRTLALALRQRSGGRPVDSMMTSHSVLLATGLRDGDTQSLRFGGPASETMQDLPIGKFMQTMALLFPIGYYDPFEQASAPEFVNPLLSQPLVELCLQLPTYLLTQGGRGRALARRAFAQDLPSQVINRRSKGGLEEHSKAVLQANLDFVRELLLDGRLAAQGLLDRGKLEEALSGRPTVLASASGQIHALVAAEAWASHWG